MALYHLSIKNGSASHGGAPAEYIERAGIYTEREDLQLSESGNLPAWAP